MVWGLGGPDLHRWKEAPCSSRQQVRAPKDKDGCRKPVGAGGSSTRSITPSTPTARYMDVHRSGAWTPGQRWIQLQQRRCHRNTKFAGAGAAGTRMATALPSPSGRRRWTSRLWEPKRPRALSRHGSAIPPPLVASNKNGGAASFPPLPLLQDAWNPFSKMKRGKDSVPGKIAWKAGTVRRKHREGLSAPGKNPASRQVFVDPGWTHQNIETIEPHAAESLHQFPRKKQPITRLV